MNTIYILWLRQLKRYFRSRSRIIGSVGQPLLFLLGLGFGFGPIYQKAGGGNYIQFLSPGIIAMTILFTALFTGMEVIWDKQFGFLKETLVAPVSRFSIMMGRTLGGASVAIIQGFIVLGIAMIVGFRPDIQMLPVATLFMIMIAILFSALGNAIASQIDDMQAFPLITNFLIMPIFFLSGALFPLEGLPKAISFIVSINPLTYGVDGLRMALTGGVNARMSIDGLVLFGVTMILLAVGSYCFTKIEV